jgi:carboxypeptidase Taq
VKKTDISDTMDNAKREPQAASSEVKLAELKRRLLEISDLRAAGALLSWDHATYMPTRGATPRARQSAIVSRLAHEKSVAPELGKLLEELEPYAGSLSYESNEASLVRVARYDFEKAIKVPSDYVSRVSAFGASAYDAWKRARPANDFAAMVPFLEKAVDLGREYAEFFAPYEHVADPHIDDADEGMTAASIRELFAELRRELVPIVQAICDQPPANNACLHGFFGEVAQLDFGLSVIKQIGYDFDRGRLDKTLHPFCTRLSAGDVRITTRVDESDIREALFSNLHETGHALYEQGVDLALDGTPLGRGASVGMHESQSRLWENVVGRGRSFWEYFYPSLQSAFPDQLSRVPVETFYRAINRVERSLIRTDADEVTYNLHIMLRFELELELLESRLRAKDLSEAWRARMKDYLGIAPADDRDGCLQDVHWYTGSMGGAFQSYTIGNILSAQFYAAALKAHPDIPGEIATGEFSTLHVWLREQLYQHGRKLKPFELVERTTGERISVAPYLDYLRAKFGELYQLPSVKMEDRQRSTH